jgi:hypothetical protein
MAVASQASAGVVAVALLIAALAALHVFGNALGTRLRDASSGVQLDRPAGGRVPLSPRQLSRLPPSTALREHLPMVGHTLVLMIVLCAVGASALMFRFTSDAWDRIPPVGVVILEVSAALIGGLFGFLAVRLTSAVRSALRHPPRNERGTRRAPTRNG